MGGAELMICSCDPQVRTSGVFALGTYVANSTDVKSEQVTSINLSVGTRLLPLMFDGSSLVRQVRATPQLIVSYLRKIWS